MSGIVYEFFDRPVFLIGYDIESLEMTPQFLKVAVLLHHDLGIPATFFIRGQTFLRFASALADVKDDPLFDLQQHTFTHMVFKRLVIQFDDGRPPEVVSKDQDLEDIRAEVAETNELFTDHGFAIPQGMTTPYAFYRGLLDDPEIVRVLWECGIRFVRSYGRNHRNYNPVPIEVQPFWYSKNGHEFPLLECCVQDWQDCVWLERFGWDRQEEFIHHYLDVLEEVYAKGLTFSFCRHDWSSMQNDPTMSSTRAILEGARDLGFQIMHYLDFYTLAWNRTFKGSNTISLDRPRQTRPRR